MGRYTYYYTLARYMGVYVYYYIVLQWYYSSGRRNPVPAIPSITLVEEKKRKNTNQKPIKKTFTYYIIIVHVCLFCIVVRGPSFGGRKQNNILPDDDDIDLIRTRPRTLRWRR